MTEYGPEVPVSRVCESLLAWAQVLEENPDNGMQGSGLGTELTPGSIRFLLSCMYKSNLLWRLIYLGEPLRTEKCPNHDGRWQGCGWSPPFCDCQKVKLPDGRVVYDANVTGWLLAGNPPIDPMEGTR